MITTTQAKISPSEVHEILAQHVLKDGFDMVLDLEKSRGVWLYDSLHNRRYLDFFTSFASYPVGFSHPMLDNEEFKRDILPAALIKVANSDLYTTEMARFVEKFAQTIPEALRHHLFFVSGGALAVENTLKTAFDWKVRKNLAAGRGRLGHQIIHFKEAFHGRSGYTLSLTNTDPNKTKYFPQFDWPRISNPKLHFPITEEGLELVEKAEALAIAEIKQALVDYPHDIAGLIIEPIQGEGGDNHFRPEFFRALRTLADEGDFLLIFDEVQTGFGSTGKYWAFEQFGITPDLIAFGKKTQVCGIACSYRVDEVDSVFQVSSRINSTWGGNLVDMIRCRRFVDIIEEENLLERTTRVGQELRNGLSLIADEFPGMDNVRGIGSFVAFDLPDMATRNSVLQAMRKHELIGLPSGPRAVRFRTPLVLQSDEAQEGLMRTQLAIQDVLA